MPWVGEWPGGRIWQDPKGRKTYQIRKSINGKRFEVSTRCTTLRAAMKFLETFEKDPDMFRVGNVHSERLTLDATLVDQFCKWSLNEKRNTKNWVSKQRIILDWWKDHLAGRDLRKLTLVDDIDPLLEGVPWRAKRIAVLKALYGYLRKVVHLLTHAEDPTLDLTVPQSKPAQWTRSKVVSREDEARIVAALDDANADLVRLLAATGMHLSEAVRFAEGGEVERRGAQFILQLPHTKRGGVHRMDVSVETAEVAERVRGRGAFSDSTFHKAFQKACRDLKLKYGPGNFRHTFATRQIEAGATPESVAAYLNHRSKATTMKFYAVLGVVPRPAAA